MKGIIPQVISTLERIQEVNQMLAFHRTFAEPDENAIENFQDLRNDFMQQLAELMKAFELEVRWKDAA
ncbi:MAG: hypothetical protein AAFO82_02865 [Bacteroidota bacterium]